MFSHDNSGVVDLAAYRRALESKSSPSEANSGDGDHMLAIYKYVAYAFISTMGHQKNPPLLSFIRLSKQLDALKQELIATLAIKKMGLSSNFEELIRENFSNNLQQYQEFISLYSDTEKKSAEEVADDFGMYLYRNNNLNINLSQSTELVGQQWIENYSKEDIKGLMERLSSIMRNGRVVESLTAAGHAYNISVEQGRLEKIAKRVSHGDFIYLGNLCKEIITAADVDTAYMFASAFAFAATTFSELPEMSNFGRDMSHASMMVMNLASQKKYDVSLIKVDEEDLQVFQHGGFFHADLDMNFEVWEYYQSKYSLDYDASRRLVEEVSGMLARRKKKEWDESEQFALLKKLRSQVESLNENYSLRLGEDTVGSTVIAILSNGVSEISMHLHNENNNYYLSYTSQSTLRSLGDRTSPGRRNYIRVPIIADSLTPKILDTLLDDMEHFHTGINYKKLDSFLTSTEHDKLEKEMKYAELVRKLVADGTDRGIIPQTVKITVAEPHFGSVRISIRSLPFEIFMHSDEYLAMKKRVQELGLNEYEEVRAASFSMYTKAYSALVDVLEKIGGKYIYCTNHDPYGDYGSSYNYHLSVYPTNALEDEDLQEGLETESITDRNANIFPPFHFVNNEPFSILGVTKNSGDKIDKKTIDEAVSMANHICTDIAEMTINERSDKHQFESIANARKLIKEIEKRIPLKGIIGGYATPLFLSTLSLLDKAERDCFCALISSAAEKSITQSSGQRHSKNGLVIDIQSDFVSMAKGFGSAEGTYSINIQPGPESTVNCLPETVVVDVTVDIGGKETVLGRKYCLYDPVDIEESIKKIQHLSITNNTNLLIALDRMGLRWWGHEHADNVGVVVGFGDNSFFYSRINPDDISEATRKDLLRLEHYEANNKITTFEADVYQFILLECQRRQNKSNVSSMEIGTSGHAVFTFDDGEVIAFLSDQYYQGKLPQARAYIDAYVRERNIEVFDSSEKSLSFSAELIKDKSITSEQHTVLGDEMRYGRKDLSVIKFRPEILKDFVYVDNYSPYLLAADGTKLTLNDTQKAKLKRLMPGHSYSLRADELTIGEVENKPEVREGIAPTIQ